MKKIIAYHMHDPNENHENAEMILQMLIETNEKKIYEEMEKRLKHKKDS